MADWSFFANGPEADSPASMDMRRKIALQMMAQGARKGYPKNVGEGIASIGDSLGEALMMKQLASREAAYRKQQEDDLEKGRTGGGAAPAPAAAAPGRTSDAGDVITPPNDVVAADDTPAPPAAAPVQVAALPPVPPSVLPPQRMGTGAPAVPGSNASGVFPDTETALTEPPRDSLSSRERIAQAMTMNNTPGWYPWPRGANNVAPWLQDAQSTQQAMAPAAPGLSVAAVPSPNQVVASRGGVASDPAPYTAADAAGDKTLADTIGFSKGPTGAYTYSPTALAQSGDTMNDAAPITGISPKLGGAVADTIQQRDDIARTLQPAPVVPEVNPTQAAIPTAVGSPPEAANNRPITMPDVKPLPAEPVPVPGAQTAQALPPNMPPSVKPPGAPQEPIPAAESFGRVPIDPRFQKSPSIEPAPMLRPKSDLQKYNERVRDIYRDDPIRFGAAQDIIASEEKNRQDELNSRTKAWEARTEVAKDTYKKELERGVKIPQTEADLQKLEQDRQARDVAEKWSRRFGPEGPAPFRKGIEDSYKDVKGLAQQTRSINQITETLKNDKMFTGTLAEMNTTRSKILHAFGFPLDPKVADTEKFATLMAPLVAQARREISGNANISDKDVETSMKASGADPKLEKETMLSVMDELRQVALMKAVEHNRKVRDFAGDDPEYQARMYNQLGVPGLEHLIPQGAVDELRAHASDPKAHEEFDNDFNTPGLSRRVLQSRK